jgi:hypothetical protein
MRIFVFGFGQNQAYDRRAGAMHRNHAVGFVMGASAVCLCAVVAARPRMEALRPSSAQLKSLRLAIEDLNATYGERYGAGLRYVRLLSDIERDLAAKDPAARTRAALSFRSFRREALLAHPLLAGAEILFVERPQYPNDHHNTGNMFQAGEINANSFRRMRGGSLKAVDVKSGKVRTLVHCKNGTPRDPEIRHDGRRILFSMRRDIEDDYHLYEIRPDGSDLKQLTRAKGVTDIDPFYLSNGGIGFSSTREPKYCGCNRHIMANLFRMEGDGANIVQIGRSLQFEGHGTQLADGRIIYFRWEYVDRNFGGGQGLWVSNPDGTNPAIFYGQSTPHAILNPRPIPGSPQVICIVSSCHDRPWGALAILDTRLGIEGERPIVRIWPASARRLIADADRNYAGSGGFDNFKRVNPKYEDPYPLTDRHFLVSRTISKTGKGEKTGIYLLDRFGNEVRVHESTSGMGCFDPMPIRARRAAKVVPTRRNYLNREGTFYVANVYEGTHMKGVHAGSVKSLRVVEAPPKLFWTRGAWGGQGQEAPAMNWHNFDNKRVLGTVPVEADGSAFFDVPSDRFVYFQLLDRQGKMVQSMRSGVVVQSGEVASCTGCHADRRKAPSSAYHRGLALRRPPSRLDGWYGKPRDFNFMTEVQPVFNRNCVSCHDYGAAGEDAVNLAPDRTIVFNTAYMELHRRGLIQPAGAGPNRILEALTWGAHASKLIETIDEGHHGVTLSAEDYARIVTWIDLNAPYYPTYASAYERNPAGRSPIDDRQIKRLQQLTGKRIRLGHGAGPLVSFDRPERSPILAGLEMRNPDAYREAIAIIRSGKESLAKKARGEMPGFVACKTDRERQAKYEKLNSSELRARAATAAGNKVYD